MISLPIEAVAVAMAGAGAMKEISGKSRISFYSYLFALCCIPVDLARNLIKLFREAI